jgi:hypothetical protein
MTPAMEARIRDAITAFGDAIVTALKEEARPADAPDQLLDLETVRKRLGLASRSALYSILDRPDGIRTRHVGRRRLAIESSVNAFVAGDLPRGKSA